MKGKWHFWEEIHVMGVSNGVIRSKFISRRVKRRSYKTTHFYVHVKLGLWIKKSQNERKVSRRMYGRKMSEEYWERRIKTDIRCLITHKWEVKKIVVVGWDKTSRWKFWGKRTTGYWKNARRPRRRWIENVTEELEEMRIPDPRKNWKNWKKWRKLQVWMAWVQPVCIN